MPSWTRAMDVSNTVTMEPPASLQQAQAEGKAALAYAPQDLVPAQLLDGGEIVILAIKPSLWFIVFNSSRWFGVLALFVLVAAWVSPRWYWIEPRVLIQGAIGLAALRVTVASMQWVSRLYVLTNRRLMRIRGIFNVDIFECNLARIQNTFMRLRWYERVCRLGTIDITTAGTGAIEASWEHVPRPLEVHDAIRRAISGYRNNTRNGL